MTIQECYQALGGNYDEVLERLRRESMVQKFLLKFPSDGSFALLCSSMETGDRQEAFRAAHTLKGVCQTLGFTRLYLSSSALTEALRAGGGPEDPELLERVREDYGVTVAAIERFQREKEES